MDEATKREWNKLTLKQKKWLVKITKYSSRKGHKIYWKIDENGELITVLLGL
jgi:hypothetical protein